MRSVPCNFTGVVLCVSLLAVSVCGDGVCARVDVHA